jgi:hypothetical protein
MNLRRLVGTAAFLFLPVLGQPLFAQVITNVTPPLASHGLQLVNIFGNGFAPGGHRPNTLSVDINGSVSTTDTNKVASDGQITITNIPAAATSGFIHVFINGSKATSPQQFIVISTTAYATNFSPIYGANDTTVTVTGVHFQTGQITNVMFNGIVSKKTATTPVLNSDNSITVTAPTAVTSGPLILMSKFGATHNFSTASNVITTATNFFVAPQITSFAPTNGRPNANVIITGVNLTAISAVTFGSVSALSFIISNNTTILATVASNVSTAPIFISPPADTILPQAQSTLSFRMLPTIFSFSPNLGPSNTSITISGAGLNEKAPHPDVTVGGGTVTTFGTISPNTLTFIVPATATSGFITITTTNGSISSTQLFYLPARITSFTPTNGAAGTIVQIIGQNFTNASAVTFNGTPASTFSVVNNTTITATAPVGVTSGQISITTPFGSTNSAGLFYVAPTVTSFTPNHGVPGTRVMITGTSFTNASAVSFNGTPAASFIVTNNTTLSAVVSDDTTTGKITVTAPGGSGSSAADFTIDSADVGVSITDTPDPVFIGSNLVYTVRITNSGPVTALNVTLTETLPGSVTLKSSATSQGSLNTNNNPVIGSLGSINANSTALVTLTVIPHASGTIVDTASVTTDSQDPNSANNSSSINTTVWPLPFLSITNLMSNDLLRVSWPAPLSGFTLQFATNLSPNIFWTNDVSAKVVSGTNVSVIETNLGMPKFFRLTN